MSTMLWLCILSLMLAFCEASHLAYGTINWKKREGGEPWEYTVTLELGMRITYFSYYGDMPEEGEAFDPTVGARFSVGYQPEDCAQPNCGDACYTAQRECRYNDCYSTGEEEPPHKCLHTGGEQLTFFTYDFLNEVVVDKKYDGNDYWIGHHEVPPLK